MACRLGNAFTSGRKSAPAEFQEVENQLYSLSKALEILVEHKTPIWKGRQGQETNQQDDVLGLMISNCHATLNHLESLINTYTELRIDDTQPSEVGERKWSTKMKDCWRKVRWTTEGGDLSKLRSDLGVHTNGLNLAISAIIR